jgi:hypothetical protein
LQWTIGILAVVLIPVDVLVSRLGPAEFEGIVSIAILALLALLVVVGNVTDERTQVGRWRARRQSVLRAGGRQAFRAAVRSSGTGSDRR